MKKKKVIVPNIVAGGTAVPLGSNYYLMRGRKHEEGGIDVGANPRTGLEVEDGEVMQLKDKEVRVFSTVPFLNGQSPAQKVIGGENPNKVFAQQEAYKDRNNINDDGTRKAKYGKSSAIRTDNDKNVSAYNRAVYSSVDPTMGYPTKTEAAKYAIGSVIKSIANPDKMSYTVNDSVSDAAWRKRLGLSYDNKFLLPNKDGSVRLPKNLEREIPTDTVMLKNRIAANEKLAAKYPKHLSNGSTNEKREIVDWALLVDNMALDALRRTYKTGEPVVINEGAYNSRRLIENGELSYPGIMPHNVLQDYTLKYNKDNDTMEYSDIYDFNEYEWGVPGEPFNIKGSIPLKNAKGYGGNHPLNTKYKQKQVIDMKDNNSRTKAKAGLRYILQTNGNSRLGYVPSTGESLSGAKGRDKAELGIFKKVANWVEEHPNTTSDIASAVSNIGGGLTSYLINRNMLKDLSYDRKPIPRIATKLKTNININPQLDKMRESLANYERNIDANTASSQVGLARKQKARANSLSGYNELYGYKENAETGLINKDRLNQQEVANQSIADYNTYLENKMTFDNAVREKQADNTVNLVNNLNKTFQGLITTGEKRKADKTNALAIMAANPNVNPRILREIGITSITDDMIENWEKINLKKGQ